SGRGKGVRQMGSPAAGTFLTAKALKFRTRTVSATTDVPTENRARKARFFVLMGREEGPLSDLLNLLHFGHEMAKQILDAVFQRSRRRRATGAGALHVQKHDAVLITTEGDIAAILGNCRPHPRVEQLLDGEDDLLVGLVVKFLAVFTLLHIRRARHYGLT